MQIRKEKLRPMGSPLVGFTGDRVNPLGSITLPETLSSEPHQATHMVNFLVVDCPSAYNAIVGRTALNKFKAVTSTYHLRIKFPTESGVGCAKGDQKEAHECYIASLKGEISKEALVIEELEPRDEQELRRGEPVEALEDVMVGKPEQSRVVQIGTAAPEHLKE